MTDREKVSARYPDARVSYTDNYGGKHVYSEGAWLGGNARGSTAKTEDEAWADAAARLNAAKGEGETLVDRVAKVAETMKYLPEWNKGTALNERSPIPAAAPEVAAPEPDKWRGVMVLVEEMEKRSMPIRAIADLTCPTCKGDCLQPWSVFGGAPCLDCDSTGKVSATDWKVEAEKLAAAMKVISDKRFLIIFAENYEHVNIFMEPVDSALTKYKEATDAK